MILDGKTIANHILENLSLRVHNLKKNYNAEPHMAVIRIGEDKATSSYVAQKEKTAKKIGALVSVYNCPENVTQEEIQDTVDFLQRKGAIQGIILQLPVPKNIDEEKIIGSIHPEKDVDGFTKNSPFVVPVASAVIKMLEVVWEKSERRGDGSGGPPSSARSELVERGHRMGVASGRTPSDFISWLKTKNTTVIGKGPTGGQPVIDLLKKMGVEPKIIDSKTKNPSEITKNADIIVSAVGKKGIITKDMIKKDVILISIGMGLEDGKFFGDYDENDIKDKASWYSPVPGGTGPVNVACLMENLVIAAEESARN